MTTHTHIPEYDPKLEEEARQYGYVGLFSHRDSMQEAYDFGVSIAEASENTAQVITAVQVIINTHALSHAKVVRVIKELEELARATKSWFEQNEGGSGRRRMAIREGAVEAIKNAEPYLRGVELASEVGVNDASADTNTNTTTDEEHNQ